MDCPGGGAEDDVDADGDVDFELHPTKFATKSSDAKPASNQVRRMSSNLAGRGCGRSESNRYPMLSASVARPEFRG
ncbi:hypothetical protein MBRA_39310 [Mycobacterium branderi]|uniref:Uncharacterized protein n=1 Tax=Mycobacterium branderi TaxID=43348 RepID=A0ABN6B7S6_9MYCO|nr:hypothetical protein MBRA_39310 [Mycobacterium branderi]